MAYTTVDGDLDVGDFGSVLAIGGNWNFGGKCLGKKYNRVSGTWFIGDLESGTINGFFRLDEAMFDELSKFLNKLNEKSQLAIVPI